MEKMELKLEVTKEQRFFTKTAHDNATVEVELELRNGGADLTVSVFVDDMIFWQNSIFIPATHSLTQAVNEEVRKAFIIFEDFLDAWTNLHSFLATKWGLSRV